MSDFLSLVFVFCLPVAVIFAAVFFIPIWMSICTEAESDSNHIYNVFWLEAGSRGQKITSATGCLLPFFAFASSSINFVLSAVSLVVAIVCFFYHRTVYKDYDVLSKKMVGVASAALFLFVVLTILVRMGSVPIWFLTFILRKL